MNYSINVHNHLLSLQRPCVMAILNATPDSFYSGSCLASASDAVGRAEKAVEEGATILDIGACSTRPGSEPPSLNEEWQRLYPILKVVRTALPDVPVSVDTYRSEIAQYAIDEGADIINDVSGGSEAMFNCVAQRHIPYILTHNNPISSYKNDYEGTMSDVTAVLQIRLNDLRQRGVSDVMIDPGLGFQKTTAQDYSLLRNMKILSVLHAPIVVGLSRKSMLYQPLQTTPEQALNATTAAHMIALQQGASILRVHDVRAAIEAIKIYSLTYLES